MSSIQFLYIKMFSSLSSFIASSTTTIIIVDVVAVHYVSNAGLLLYFQGSCHTPQFAPQPLTPSMNIFLFRAARSSTFTFVSFFITNVLCRSAMF
ncbi:hypothetical protein BJV74DRAFT_259436 [Russula compacta]|nr:hypothetical protein BJV74DRAFT_259436 [Russula compacta]